MKIGIISSAYNCAEYLEEALRPWGEFKEESDTTISVVHVCFKENQELGFPPKSSDDTESILKELNDEKIIDFLHIERKPLDEADSKSICLDYLKKQDVDYMWLLGLDEIYTVDQIKQIIKFVEFNKFITWFSINFKNYLFNDNTWVDGFCPPRIFNMKCNGGIDRLYYDDDVIYNDGSDYKVTSHLEIPRHIAHIRHMTWLNNETSKMKCEYQKYRWGEDFCSYLWNYDTSELEFNENYYEKHNKQKPNLNYD
jgi:hypothetical protein